jgi:hypothetical protein
VLRAEEACDAAARDALERLNEEWRPVGSADSRSGQEPETSPMASPLPYPPDMFHENERESRPRMILVIIALILFGLLSLLHPNNWGATI